MPIDRHPDAGLSRLAEPPVPDLERTLAETWGAPEAMPSARLCSAAAMSSCCCSPIAVRWVIASQATTSTARRATPTSRSMLCARRETRPGHARTHGTLNGCRQGAGAVGDCWPEAVLGAAGDLSLHRQQSRRGGRPSGVWPPSPSATHAAALRRRPAARWPSWKASSRNMRGRRPRPPASLPRRRSSNVLERRLAADCELLKGEPNRQAIAKLDAQLCDIKELSIATACTSLARRPTRRRCRRSRWRPEETAIRACGDRERAALVAASTTPRDPVLPARRRAAAPTCCRRGATSLIDPRAIPTRTASAIGVRAANEVAPLPAGSWRAAARWSSTCGPRRRRTGGDDLRSAVVSRRSRPGTRPERVTGIETCRWPCSPAAHRRDVAHLRPVPRHLREADRAVRHGGAAIAELDEEAATTAWARRHGADGARVRRCPGSYGAGGRYGARRRLAHPRRAGEVYLAAVTRAYGPEPVRRAGFRNAFPRPTR